jgi:hypothetical protein
MTLLLEARVMMKKEDKNNHDALSCFDLTKTTRPFSAVILSVELRKMTEEKSTKKEKEEKSSKSETRVALIAKKLV